MNVLFWIMAALGAFSVLFALALCRLNAGKQEEEDAIALRALIEMKRGAVAQKEKEEE